MTQNTWPDWRELPEQQRNRLIILDYVHAMYAEGRADGIPDHWAMIAEADYIEHGFDVDHDDDDGEEDPGDDDDGEEDPGDGIPDHEHTRGKFIGDWLKCQYCGDEWYGWGDPSARILAAPRPGGYMERSQSAAHDAMIAAGQCQCDQCRARGLEDQPDDDDEEEDPGDGIPDHEHTRARFAGDWLKCQYCGDIWDGGGGLYVRTLAAPRPGGYMDRSQSAAHDAMIAAGQCQCHQCRARGLEDQPGEGTASIPVTEPDPISADDDDDAPAFATVYAVREGTPLPTTLDEFAGWEPIGYTTVEALAADAPAKARPTRPIHPATPATLTDNGRPYTMTDQQLRDFIARMKDETAAAREAMKPRIQVEELSAALRRGALAKLGAALDQAIAGRAPGPKPGDDEQ